MHPSPEPLLRPVPLASLRPTQMTVGLLEVERKRHDWRSLEPLRGSEFLGAHMIPVVIGPKGVPWLIDHHHLAYALLAEGVSDVLVAIVARLDGLDKGSFLTFMDNRNWLHTFDATGARCGYDKLPRKLLKMTDDPYRSLAGATRRAGGCAKSETPYSEFLWADFLRGRVTRKSVEHDFARAVDKAVGIARGPSARHLPGWCGTD